MYMLGFMLLALLIAATLNSVFSNAETERALSYMKSPAENYEYWNSRGIYTDEGRFYIFSEEDSAFIRACSILWSAPYWQAFCIIGTS